jgi:hypothetical protein
MYKMEEVKREKKKIRFLLKNNKFYVYENCSASIESRNGTVWIQSAIDRARFKRRCQEIELMLLSKNILKANK